MDSKDRPDLTAPALPVRGALTQPAMAEASFPLSPSGSSSGSPNIVLLTLRAFTRHWVKILAIWSVLTGVVFVAIHLKIKPMYEATSLLRAEPANPDLFRPGSNSSEIFNYFLQTQVQLITSASVLNEAIASAEVSRTAIIAEILAKGHDPEMEIRRRLHASIVPNTYLITVSMTTPRQEDAPLIVDKVVKVYLDRAKRWYKDKNESQILSLQDYYDELGGKIERKKEEWTNIVQNTNIDLEKASQTGPGSSTLPVPLPNQVSIDQYKSVRTEHFQVTMKLIEAEALLATRQADLDAQVAGVPSDVLDQRRLNEELHRDPEYASLKSQYDQLIQRHKNLERLTRSPLDPSRRNAEAQLRAVTSKLNELKERKKEEMALYPADPANKTGLEELHQLSSDIAEMKAKLKSFDELLRKIDVQGRDQETASVKAAFIREDLTTLQSLQDSVMTRIEQLRFDSKGDARINEIDKATDGKLVSDKRKQYLTIAPVGVFALVLGLFLLFEIRSGRVADLDEVSRRVPVEVYSLPALPRTRQAADQRALRNNEFQLAEFLQSLDHLRVSLWCGHEATPGMGRCLMVTSAMGGEGKTTLTSHLAVCCAKAGISTLVIDGDLRRASLSRTFQEEKNLGFSDVLKGDIPLEEGLIMLQEGGFHLLPAGTPGQHPGWLYREQRVGQLLERYRRMFDLVIIDTPPVLPVPDALSLGRWVDGAVLVLRYDVSRFALIDRARKRLISSGIPILKTVVNGVRSSRLSFGYGGGYGYKEGYIERTAPAGPADPSADGYDSSFMAGGSTESSSA